MASISRIQFLLPVIVIVLGVIKFDDPYYEGRRSMPFKYASLNRLFYG